MRPGMTTEITNALGAGSITTAIAARLEFKSGPVFVWTGLHALTVSGSGDSLLNGNTFDPLAAGVMVEIGENTFSYSGSNELTISLNIPSSPEIAIAAAQTYPAEYQGRFAKLWRAIRIDTGNPLDEPVWVFKPIRTGTMDRVEITGDGQSHRFTLTIESHQSRVSNATNQTYLDQPKYDPLDTSQNSAAAIANGDPAPTKGSGIAYQGGGYGGGMAGGHYQANVSHL